MRTTWILVTAGLLGCQPDAERPADDVQGADDLVLGLQRIGRTSGYHAGTVEHLRVMLADDADLRLRFAPSGGSVQATGDEVYWQLPEPGTAELRVVAERPDDGAVAEATFRFAVGEALDDPQDERFAVAVAAGGPITPNSDDEGRCDLALTSNDRPRVIYRNNVHPSLFYATFDGAGWAHDLVDGQGFDVGRTVDTPMALVLDDNDLPHIAYQYVDDTLRYAHHDGTRWILEDVGVTQSPAAPHLAIALDPASGDEPVIFWTTLLADEQHAIAYRTGPGSWSTDISVAGAPGDDHFATGAMVFAPNGEATVAVSSDQPIGLHVATWSRAAGFSPLAQVTPLSNGVSRARAVLDDVGRVVLLHNYGVEHDLGGGYNHSDIEQSSLALFDLAWNVDRPVAALRHGSGLEVVTPNNRGYWLYNEQAPSVTNDELSVAVDSAGVPHGCFTTNGDVHFY